MGLMRKLRNELVDIIEHLDDSRSMLAWRFPRYQNEIKNGAQLIVREGQRAVFVYRGALADQFEPGNYKLSSENLPILGTLQGWKHGFNSPFRSEVYFINTRMTEVLWGTPAPVVIRDPDFEMVEVRANGMCQVKVDDTAIFLREIIGTDSHVDAEEITELLRQVIVTAFGDMIVETQLGIMDLQGRKREVSERLRQYVQERVDDEFGLAIPAIDFNLTLPQEIRDAITRGTARGREERSFLNQVDDLDRYTQAKAADAMIAAANNPGGGGTMGDLMGLGVGMAMASQMANTFNQPNQQTAATPPPLPGAVTYHVAQNGRQSGPFTIEQIQQGLSAGQMQPTDMVWSPGMAAWAPANTVPAIAALLAAVPPPLPQNPPPVPPSEPPPAGH